MVTRVTIAILLAVSMLAAEEKVLLLRASPLSYTCGDGVITSPPEVCDITGPQLGGQACETIGGYDCGTLSCAPGCLAFSTVGCIPSPACGNGTVDSICGEQCDDDDPEVFDPSNDTCQEVVGPNYSGTLACNTDCTIDSSGCSFDGTDCTGSVGGQQYCTYDLSCPNSDCCENTQPNLCQLTRIEITEACGPTTTSTISYYTGQTDSDNRLVFVAYEDDGSGLQPTSLIGSTGPLFNPAGPDDGLWTTAFAAEMAGPSYYWIGFCAETNNIYVYRTYDGTGTQVRKSVADFTAPPQNWGAVLPSERRTRREYLYVTF